MEKQKVYCGSGKKRSDNWRSVTINLDKIKEHIQEYNGSKFIRININDKKEPDQYGKDLSVTIDTWKPEESQFRHKIDPNFTHDNTVPSDLPF